ncbi:U3 snoRNP protein [Perkinsus olseni]|uniref:U3 snoRNP protein n=4 Tax=Perkinsus olseni TaxID=32597 RepID=A0A7J6NX13_PEROL|nr:U3 snoRNP protein [Perkinsus olseni]
MSATSPSSSSEPPSSPDLPDGAATKVTSGEPSVATRLSFGFTNLIGPTYSGGPVRFSTRKTSSSQDAQPPPSLLLSTVSSRVQVTDLSRSNRTACLPMEVRGSAIAAMTASPDNSLLFTVDTDGFAMVVALSTGLVLHRMNLKTKTVRAAEFSPDGRYIAVTSGRKVVVWYAPSASTGWQMVVKHTFAGHIDEVMHLSWSADSNALISSGNDMMVRVWVLDHSKSDIPSGCLVEHQAPVRGSYFGKSGKDIYSVARNGFLLHWMVDDSGTWALQSKNHLEAVKGGTVTAVGFDAFSDMLVLGLSHGIFALYEVTTMALLQQLSLVSATTLGGSAGCSITHADISPGGDWICIGSAHARQLLVYEWRSETWILKQQGHHHGVRCVAYSPLAGSTRPKAGSTITAGQNHRQLLATGGMEGKVKLWDTVSGFCYATFADHTSTVEGVCFTPTGNAVISASLDGSVRAYDSLRYRNFRVMTAPSSSGLVQFTTVSVDGGGDVVAAGGTSAQAPGAVYLWALKTGDCIDVLSGHEARVSALDFCWDSSLLASTSWDRTLRVWDVYGRQTKAGSGESLIHQGQVTACAFARNTEKNILATATQAGHIYFWDTTEGREMGGSIDASRDIAAGRGQGSRATGGLTSGKKARRDGTGGLADITQYFTDLCFSPNGQWLAAVCPRSPYLMIYDTRLRVLLCRTTMTCAQGNIIGTKRFLNSKLDRGTDTGAALAIAVQDQEYEELEGADRKRKRITQAERLPGVKAGYGSKQDYQLWRVYGLTVSGDGRQVCVATSLGAHVFSSDRVAPGADSSTAALAFTPVTGLLTERVNVEQIVKMVKDENWPAAVVMALVTGDAKIIDYVFDAVPMDPPDSIAACIGSVGLRLLPTLIATLSRRLRDSPHLEANMLWARLALEMQYQNLDRELHNFADGSGTEAGSSLRVALVALLEQVLAHRKAADSIGCLMRDNTHALMYLANAKSAGDA